MRNIEIMIEKSWTCDECDGINYWLRAFCIHCLASNKNYNAMKKENMADIEGTREILLQDDISDGRKKERDLAFKEIMEESHYLLCASDYKTIIKRYKNLIPKYQAEEGNKSYKAIYLLEQIALIQEQLFHFKEAVNSLEDAASCWCRYGKSDDHHDQFILTRLTNCHNYLHDIIDFSRRPRKEVRQLYHQYKEKYGQNSTQALSICISLSKFEFLRGQNVYGGIYLMDSLQIHEKMFWEAVNRISNINTKAA
jgi:hypothetical protein